MGNNGILNQNFQPLANIPEFPESATANQQVLYALAKGTGGFPIFNSNDLVGGLEKIAEELNEFYVLGYVPPHQAHDGAYHEIKVKVEGHGLEVRSRNGYYDVRGSGGNAAKPEDKVLEARAVDSSPGNIPASATAFYVYSSPNVARLNLALEVPGKSFDFQKEKGKFTLDARVLGLATRPDGTVAARFSDSIKRELNKGEWKEFSKNPFDYQNTFDIAPGKYTLKVVLSAGGDNFAKYEAPLQIDPFDGKHFTMSGVALSDEIHQAAQDAAGIDLALLEDRTPLVSNGVELIPSADNHFKTSDKVGLYCEVYEPDPIINGYPHVGIIVNVIDKNTKQQVYTSNTILVNSMAQQGSIVIPVAVPLPMTQLKPGDYRLEVLARDSEGNESQLQASNFILE